MMPESRLLRAAVVFYILHVLLHHKIALVMLMGFGCIFAVSWALARGEARFSWHILYYPLIVYGLVTTISSLAANRRIHEVGEPVLWYKMLIFPAAILLYRHVPLLKERILYAYALLSGGSAVWGLIQFFAFGQRDLDRRIMGPASHVMTFSGIMLPLAVMFLLLWWHERKPLYLAVAVVSNVTLLLTFTRSSWLGWLTAMFVVLLMKRTQIRWFAPALLLLFLMLLPLPLFSRLISTFDVKQESNFDRIRMIQAGVEIIKDYPVLGVGPGNVKEYYSIYMKPDAPRVRPPHLHNNIVQLWAERGILGLAAYIVFLGLFVRECLLARHGPQRAWGEIGIGIIVSLAVAGLFEFNFGDTEVFYLTLNLTALVAVWIERPEPQPNEVAITAVPAPSVTF
jgi:O-antigen ligase